ncbi:MAG TPA: ribbon-helix-helix domain-containing protein [Egibacteraceae bacterium]|jgi:Arc/MetJ-type ribon-helix-helix transcriptional regulator|nr:ribbon-helix-helix domain-containing protein [Egibacteraceae bacterium]
MTQQIAVRIPDELAHEMDGLVAAGRFASRADAVRAGLEAVIERERQRRIDEAIVEGYRRHPPTKAEERWAANSGRELIADEPW